MEGVVLREMVRTNAGLRARADNLRETDDIRATPVRA